MFVELLGGLALIFATAFLIGYPLLVRADGEAETFPADDVDADVDDRESHRERVFTELNDIEFDYRMNKLSGEDYEELRAELANEAVGILKEEEAGERETERALVETELEQEIQAELAKRLAPEKAGLVCPECGAALHDAEQRFCHSCGARLEGE